MQDDSAFLADMWLAARQILAYTDGVSWEQFGANRMLQDAVVRQIQVIGEAARCISDQLRSANPTIPWRSIIGMRHSIVHRYFEIDLVRVWGVVTRDIGDLLVMLEPLVPDEVRNLPG